MKRTLIISILCLGVAFLGWQIYQRVSQDKQSLKRERKILPVAVEVAPIQTATVQDIGWYSGSLYPYTAFVVAPKVGGRLEKIWVNIGDELQDGQLIAVLDDAEYKQQVSQARAELEVARANLLEQENALKNAQREHERAVALREKKIASESQLDASLSDLNAQEAKLKVALARVAQSEAAMRVADVRLEYTQIRLPGSNGDGYRVVGERFVDEGAMLASNTPIVSILDIGTLIAVIHVVEQDYPKINIGQEAAISTDAFPDRSFSGKVIRIAPILKEKSREARIEIEIPNPQKILKPGMFVRAQIQFEKHENAIVVPTAAVIKRDDSHGVFMVGPEGKTARFIPVTRGIVDSKRTEIRTPALSGSVVVLGQHLLEDGASIIISDNPVTADQPAEGKKTQM